MTHPCATTMAVPHKDPDARRAYAKAWREANREKLREQGKAYYEANRERHLEQGRAWHHANRDQALASSRAWHAANREQANANVKAWAAANAEKVRADGQAYRLANPGKIRTYRKAYYEQHRDKAIAYTKAWVAANPEKVRAYSRASEKNHPEASAERYRRRRTRKLAGGVFAITERDWRRLCARWGNTCAYCGADGNLDRDHVIPLSRGGRHSIGNLLPACRRCNLSKSNKLLVEWRRR